MNTQAKVALDKQKHPERFCRVNRCLWRVVKLDHATQTFSVREDCPGGYCPRHQQLRKQADLEREKNAPWRKCDRCGHFHNSHGYCG